MPSLTCSLERDSIASSYDPAAQTFFPREVVQALYDALVVEIIDRSVTLVSSDTDSATVRLDGTLAWSVSDEALRTFVDAPRRPSSPAPTPDEKEQYFQGLRSSIDTQVLAPEVQVVAEGGGWLICTDIVTEAVEPSPSPVG